MANTYEDEDIDLTKLRYVLYARKSTEDEDRQMRSIPDQIKECTQLADKLGLHVIGKALEETKSAKISGRRKIFDQMVVDIEAGKYDAILSWAPDRLSRNMLEGGKLIDLVDEGKLKDLRFPTYHFTNDASGKLTLGVLFSISKHFSDDLSRKVGRGIKGNLTEGKSAGTPKWGYDRPEDGLYVPNQFFEAVQQAWYLRGDGGTIDEVKKYLDSQNYHRLTKLTPDKKGRGKKQREIRPSKSTIATMFHDPFYYGSLVQAEQTIDLRKLPGYNFEPMIEEELYNTVQALGYRRTRDTSSKKRATFYPLYGFVYCAVCNSDRYMVVGKNKSGSGKYVLSYRCDNPTCNRKPKSFRANHVFSSLYEKLVNFELSDEAYERYSKRIGDTTEAKIIKIKEEVRSLNGVLTHKSRELKDRALAIPTMDKGSVARVTNEEKVEELAKEVGELDRKIKDLNAKVQNPQQIQATKEEFLNLLKLASAKMKAGSAVEKDVYCRILFLNLRVDNEKVASYLWREPFASLVKATEILPGRGDRT